MLQVVSNLVRVRSLVARHIARQDEARTNEFLYAASRGDTDRVLQVGQQISCSYPCACTLRPVSPSVMWSVVAHMHALQ